MIRGTWQADVSPTDPEIRSWFLHSFPIRNQRDRRNLRDGLAAAVFPDVR